MMLAACADESAVQDAKLRADFAKALQIVEQAEMGYVPAKGAGPQDSTDLWVYRQKKLAEAAAALTPLLNQGSESQQQAARMVMSDIASSASRHEANAALASWAEIARRSGRLISLLGEVDQAAYRASAFSPESYTPLVSNLKDRATASQRKLDDLRSTASALEPRIKSMSQERDKLAAEGDRQIEKAGALRDQAFVAQEPEQTTLNDQADAAERAGQKATASSREIASGLDVFESEMKIVATQIELNEKTLKLIAEQTTQVEGMQAEARKSLDAAVAEQDRAIKEMVGELETLTRDFEEQVEKRYVAADGHAVKAIDLVKKNGTKGFGQFEMVSRQIARIDILTQHQTALDSLRHTLDTVAGQSERLMPGRTVFADAARALRERQDAINESLTQQLAEASGLAAELKAANTKDNPQTTDLNEAEYAASMEARIERYSTRARGLRPNM